MIKPPQIELVSIRLPEGTLAQIDKVLRGGEVRGVFMRTAVLNEIKRRQEKSPERSNP